MPIPKKIVEFISRNNVLTLATSSENIPYCATVFYAFIPEKNFLVFMSDKTTRHIHESLSNSNVAGTILPNNISIAKVQGLQFTGKIFEISDGIAGYKKAYLKKYPVAALHSSTLWGIKFTFLKLTDHRLGFGKKLLWTVEGANG